MPNAARTGAAHAQGDRGPSPGVAACIDEARAAERVGQRAAAREHYERALRTLRSGDELPTATTLLRWIAGSHFAEANHAAADDCIEAAIACAEASGDDLAVGYAINMRGIFRWQQGELDEAVKLYTDARERAVRTGDRKLAASTAQNLGVIANIHGDFALALQFYQASLVDYRSMGLPRDVCVALNNIGMVYTDTERWDEAELVYREALELVRELGDHALRVQIEVNAVEMWVARGDFPRARAAADAAMALAAEIGDAQVPGDAYRLMGVIARETGELPLAEEHLARAAEIASARQDLLLLAETSREQAEVHRRQGRNRETLQALNRAHSLFTQLRARRDLADIDRQTTSLESEFIDVVRRWSESIEAKDRYTQGHCERVADLACALAVHAGFDERALFWFRVGALLHDVGKLIIPAEVLNKPAKLTDEEWALMRRHPEAGVELLAGIEFPWDVRPLIESHHERWDGRGYPHGLAGEDIPLTARILCLADVFDALTSQRSYKQSMSVADAMEIMRRDVGRAFDPVLFALFESVVAEREPLQTSASAGTSAAAAAASRRPHHDDLTELPLRRACTAASARLLATRRRDGGGASLLYLKVAGLDAVTRLLGKARGDDMLATVASVLRRSARRGDVLARFGTDDFVLLLADANAEQALAVAGRVRALLADGFAASPDSPPVAIGVAMAPEHGESLDALVTAARRAIDAQPDHARAALALADGAADPAHPTVEHFVGRVAELRRLGELLDAGMRGSARIVSVVGATGVGKSAVVSRLALDARRLGAAHVVGNCRPATFRPPFGPWTEIIEALRLARVIPERRWRALPRLVPSLTGSERALRLVDDDREDAPLVDEILELLSLAAATRPIVIVVEDVEHADHASWDVIDRLATRLGDDRVLLCLTTTDSYAAAMRKRFATCDRHYELRLDALAAGDVRSSMPGTALAQRIHALTPKARAIVGELALIGQVFEVDVALAAGIGDESELLDAIDEALVASLVRENGAEPGTTFAFTHQNVVDAARETLDALRLRRVHERIARGLEQVRPVALFEIAEHFDRAGVTDRAFEYALLAAARAVSVHAFADAEAAYERARANVGSARQRAQLDELVAELPVRARGAGRARRA